MENSITFTSSRERNIVLIAAVLLLVISGPYFFWWITKNIVFKWLTTFGLGYVFYTQRGLIANTDRKIQILYVLTFVYNIANTFIKGNISFFGILDTLPNLLLVFFLCGKLSFSKKVFHYFSLFYAILMGFSIIAQLSFLAVGLPSIGAIVNTTQDRVYTIYPFLIREQVVDIFNFSGTRFSGTYDEPGAIGTISAVLLCVNQFRLKDWRNIVFLLTGLLSMSLAFYVMLTFYSLAYVLLIRKNILLTLVVITSFGIFYHYTKDNPMVESLLWERIEWDEDKGTFAGEDRMVRDANIYYEKYVQGTSSFWFGLEDTKAFWATAEGSSSYRVVIAQNGFVFLFLYISCFVLLAFHHKPNKFEIIIFITLIIANTMQRPNIYQPLWVFLYAYYARVDDKKLSNQCNS